MNILIGILVVIAVTLIWAWFEIWLLQDKVKKLEENYTKLNSKVSQLSDFYDGCLDSVHRDLKIIREHLGLDK